MVLIFYGVCVFPLLFVSFFFCLVLISFILPVCFLKSEKVLELEE